MSYGPKAIGMFKRLIPGLNSLMEQSFSTCTAYMSYMYKKADMEITTLDTKGIIYDGVWMINYETGKIHVDQAKVDAMTFKQQYRLYKKINATVRFDA